MERVCELGAGNGAVSMIFNHKRPVKEMVAVEIQYSAARLACYNVNRNRLDHIEIIHSDILDLEETYYGRFDGVLTNPPYFPHWGSLSSAGKAKHVAHQETTTSLKVGLLPRGPPHLAVQLQGLAVGLHGLGVPADVVQGVGGAVQAVGLVLLGVGQGAVDVHGPLVGVQRLLRHPRVVQGVTNVVQADGLLVAGARYLGVQIQGLAVGG